MNRDEIFKKLEEQVIPGCGKIEMSLYSNYRPAIRVMVDGEMYGKLTVNLPEVKLEDGELLIKTWSENENLSGAAMKTGLFEDTGKRIPTGFCEAQVWRIKEETND